MTAVPRPLVVATVALLQGAGAVTRPAERTAATQLAAAVAPATSGRDLPDGMLRDQRAAVAAVDGYWKRHFAEHFGKRYHSPLVVGGYLGNRGPSCDGRRPLPLNAFYCRPQDFLTWDQALMSAGYRKVGRAWVYLIIAHEWGRAIQARLSRRLVSVAAELKADCLATAELAGAQRDGTVVGEPGDAEQIARTLTAVSDAYPWTKQTDHGNAKQRITAYRRGFQSGVPACFPR